jgi:hypothetical protein
VHEDVGALARVGESGAGVGVGGDQVGRAEKNAVVEPSALMSGSVLAPLAWVPALSTLTRTVAPVTRSCTNTSGRSPGIVR